MSKATEVEELVREAEKSLKTSMFKWKPDYDIAANSYQKAAIGFRSLKQFQRSYDCHIKSAECSRNAHQYFSAAKSFEQAAQVAAKDINNWDLAVQCLDKAAMLYREHGVPDTAALALDRGAKMIEAQLPEKAAEFYRHAAEVSMLESKSGQAADYCSKAARIFLKLRRIDQALTVINEQGEYYATNNDTRSLGRLIVCKVLVNLFKEDFVAAQKAYNDGKCYVEDDEIYTLNQLLKGFDEMDSKEIVAALNSPFIKNLDNEYAKLARTIQQKHGAILQSTPVHHANVAGATAVAGEEESGALL